MLYICRGIPGSGKSTYAKSLGCFHVEADFYFIINKIYEYDIKRISAAHAWCFNTVKNAIETGMDVVISNTGITYREIFPYIDLAKRMMIRYKIIEFKTNYNSIHDVPSEKIERMKSMWEDISGKEMVTVIE